jgi:hypothetical protein
MPAVDGRAYGIVVPRNAHHRTAACREIFDAAALTSSDRAATICPACTSPFVRQTGSISFHEHWRSCGQMSEALVVITFGEYDLSYISSVIPVAGEGFWAANR